MSEAVIAVAASLLLVVLSAIRIPALLSLPPPRYSTPDTRQAWTYTRSALAGRPPQAVILALYTPDTWVLGAGIALQLDKAGFPVHVHSDLVFMFGDQARATGREGIELVVVNAADTAGFEAANPAARLVSQTQAHSLYVEPPSASTARAE